MKILQKLSVFVVLALGLAHNIQAEELQIKAYSDDGHDVRISVISPSGWERSNDNGLVFLPKETGIYRYNVTMYRHKQIHNVCSGSFSVSNDTPKVELRFHLNNSCDAYIYQPQSISSLIDECVRQKIASNRETCTGMVFESKKDIAKAKEHYKKSCNNKEALACTLLAKHTNDKLQQFNLYLKSCDYDGGFVRSLNGKNEKVAGCGQAIEIMAEEKLKFINGQSNHLKQMYNKLCSVKKHKEAEKIAVICDVIKEDLR